MNAIPPQITDALEVLDREQERVTSAIAKKRAEHANLYTMADEDYHELMGLHRKRDRVANAANNLRAYYEVDKPQRCGSVEG